MKKNRFHLIFTICLAILTLFFLLRGSKEMALIKIIKNVDVRYLLIAAFVLFVFLFMEALSLKTLFQHLGIYLNLSRFFRYTLADSYVSAITPGACGGQPAKLYFMSRDGIPMAVSSLCVLLFNTCYHVSMLLIVFIAWISKSLHPVISHPALKCLLLYGILIQLSLVLLFIGLAFSNTLAPGILRRGIHALYVLRILKDEEKWLQKLNEQTSLYQNSAEYFRAYPKVLLQTFLLTTLHLLLLYSLPYWIYRSLGLKEYGLFRIVLLQAGLTIGVESLPLPGGLAASEGSFFIVFRDVFPSHLMLSGLLLSRGMSYYLVLVIGALNTWFLQKKSQRLYTPSDKKIQNKKYPAF